MLNCTLVSERLAGVNAWGYGDWAWVGLWSVQTRWAEWPLPALWDFYEFLWTIRGGFFTQRVVGVWNELPDKVVNVVNPLLTFKKNLDGFMDERGVEGYGPSAGQWD